MRNKFTDAASALHYMMQGKATITVQSRKTETRFTFKIKRANPDQPTVPSVFFVSVMTGPDNEASYSYVGILRSGDFRLTAKSKFGEDDPRVKAFAWVFGNLRQLKLPESLEIWHEGQCGRCGRKLTVPSSIESGIGPECSRRISCDAA